MKKIYESWSRNFLRSFLVCFAAVLAVLLIRHIKWHIDYKAMEADGRCINKKLYASDFLIYGAELVDDNTLVSTDREVKMVYVGNDIRSLHIKYHMDEDAGIYHVRYLPEGMSEWDDSNKVFGKLKEGYWYYEFPDNTSAIEFYPVDLPGMTVTFEDIEVNKPVLKLAWGYENIELFILAAAPVILYAVIDTVIRCFTIFKRDEHADGRVAEK